MPYQSVSTPTIARAMAAKFEIYMIWPMAMQVEKQPNVVNGGR